MVTLDGVTLDNVTLSGGTDDLDGATSTVSTDSTIENATLQDGTLTVASGQTLTLDGVTLDNVILSGGTDDLDGAYLAGEHRQHHRVRHASGRHADGGVRADLTL